jgi:hypothetical protein
MVRALVTFWGAQGSNLFDYNFYFQTPLMLEKNRDRVHNSNKRPTTLTWLFRPLSQTR